MWITNKTVYNKTDAPDDKNTTTVTNNTTTATTTINQRQKRELSDLTTTSPASSVGGDITSSPDPTQGIPTFNVNGTMSERNETNDNETIKRTTDSKETTDEDTTYPSFHVTYWMFYPYSQVRIFRK